MSAQYFDVIVVGAGISGIGSAYHLGSRLPGKSFVVLETATGPGGTWLSHQYPGVRSDSDLFTYGYRFRPWYGAPIAHGAEIQDYLDDVIADARLAEHVRYRQRLVSCHWSSDESLWHLQVEDVATGEALAYSTRFLWMCPGYYRQDAGHIPSWPGRERFNGQIVHPQAWPQDLDYAGKRVVVVGSGATAATLIPAIAGACRKVTLLQRSPTYFNVAKNANDLADQLRRLDVPEAWTHEIVRRQIVSDQNRFIQRALQKPEVVKTELIDRVRALLPMGFDVDKHFTPKYAPWRQRVAYVPDGDLFRCISAGQADVVTDEIGEITPTGVRLMSGEELDADIIVSATGFEMSVLGDVSFHVDGLKVDPADTITYRGLMFTGLPNLIWVFGYFRASWTLRVDLVADFVIALLTHMDKLGASSVRAQPDAECSSEAGPWMDLNDFGPGYLARSLHRMPKTHAGPHWRHSQDYQADLAWIAGLDLNAEPLVFTPSEPADGTIHAGAWQRERAL